MMRARLTVVPLLLAVVVAAAFSGTPEASADPGALSVTTTADGPDTAPGDGSCAAAGGACTLRAAVMEASAVKAATVITLPAGLYALAGDPVASSGSVTVRGAGASSTTIALGSMVRGFALKGGSFAFVGVTVRGGVGAFQGGAVLSAEDADVTVKDATVTGASADGDGGALSISGGALTLDHATLTGNAGQAGGAVFAGRAAVKVVGSTLSDNNASQGGGAMFLTFPTAVDLRDSTFSGNLATGSGGALFVEGYLGSTPTYQVSGTTFASNRATDKGGALFLPSSNDGVTEVPLAVSGSTLKGNTASVGGAVAIGNARLDVRASTFTGNRATEGSGGAIGSGGDLRVSGCMFEGNDAVTTGGAIGSLGRATIDKGTFRRNHAGLRGGALSLGGPAPTVRGLTLSGNVTDTGGPAVWPVLPPAGSSLVDQLTDLGGWRAQAAGGGVLVLLALALLIRRRRRRRVEEPVAGPVVEPVG
jgi:CSLREA domain-containing protein